MGIYIPDLEDDVALENALEIMTDEWIEAGNYADQTIVDLRDEAVSLRARVARLEEAVKKYRAACATPGVSYSSKAIAWAEVDRLLEGGGTMKETTTDKICGGRKRQNEFNSRRA